MRTTVTIDDNLLEAAKRRGQESGHTLGDVVERALHIYLAAPRPDFSAAPALPVFTGGGSFQSGVDPTSNASMLDAIDHDGDPA